MINAVGLILIYVVKDTCDTAPLAANEYGTGMDVVDIMDENKDENVVEDIGVNYTGYGFGGVNCGACNIG